MKRLLHVRPFDFAQAKLRFSVVGLSLLIGAALLPFSLCGVGKQKPIEEISFPIRECMFGSADSVEDRNADIVMKAFMDKKPISAVTNLLKNTRNININSHVKHSRCHYEEIFTILSCALERCNPNVNEDVELVKIILQKGATLKQQPMSRGWHPYLFYAIDKATKNNNNHNLSIIKLLIDHGADVNFRFLDERWGKEDWGTSALHYALVCFYGEDTKCIDYLLEKGADANVRHTCGDTPLAILADRFNYVMKVFKSNPLLREPNFELFELVAEKLLEHGADIFEKQERYKSDKGYFGKSNYDLLKPIMPNLDDIIKKAEDKKRIKKLAIDLKNAAAANNKHANQSIIVSGRESKLHEAFLSIRCLGLCFELNPNYIHSQFKLFSKPLLHAPFVGNNFMHNVFKQAASLISKKKRFETINQEID